MTSRLRNQADNATWLKFALWFSVWFAFNWWAFYTSSPWTRSLDAGGGKLPESQFNFPADEPQRSLDALGPATGDYILWQAFDIPYALLNLMVASSAIALALKATRLGASPLRYLLLLPALYVFCEIIENASVAAFASKLVAPDRALVFIQQAATAIKALSGFGSMGLGLFCLAVAALAAVVRLVRRPP